MVSDRKAAEAILYTLGDIAKRGRGVQALFGDLPHVVENQTTVRLTDEELQAGIQYLWTGFAMHALSNDGVRRR
jgi:hypothetical protein